MNRTEAGRSPGLDRYLARLEAELRKVPPADREEILLETRSHVVERTSRSPSRSVEDVLAELGPPEVYARQFLPQADPDPVGRADALRGIARLATGRWTTLPVFVVVVVAYAVAAVAFAIGVWKLVEPNATGLWINDFGGGRRSVQLVVSDPNQKGREVLGYWLVPIGLGIALSVHLAMSALLKRVMQSDAFRRALVVAVLAAGVSPTATAQPTSGTVLGVARSQDDGSAIPFALVRLQRLEQDTTAPVTVRQHLTTASGRFHFVNMPAGTYRLQLLRIGHRPVLSAPITVLAGDTLHHELRAPTQAVQLAAVTVRPAATCLARAQLAEDARLATLWSEAQKGVAIRRAFELQYRFTRVVRQDGEVRWRFRGAKPLLRIDTLVNEPDSVRARDERLRTRNRSEGYTEGGLLVLPNEKELLDDEFLREHCLDVATVTSAGMVGLRFRRAQPRRDRVSIRGTIWIDADTYLMRRLDVEWMDGNRSIGESQIAYSDVAVGGAVLRLPSAGRAAQRPRGVQRTLVTRATATITYDYRDFEPSRSG